MRADEEERMTEEMMKHFTRIITLVVLILVAGNVLYASTYRIEEALFFETNQVIYYAEDHNEPIYVAYIMDNDLTKIITAIKFDELEFEQILSFNRGVFAFEYVEPWGAQTTLGDKGRYYIRYHNYIELNLSDNDIVKLNKEGSISIGDGIASYSDGTTSKVSIGDVLILTKEQWLKNDMRDGGRGSETNFEQHYKTDSQIKVTDFDFTNYADIEELVDMTVEVDGYNTYTYDDLKQLAEPIVVERTMEITFEVKDPDQSGHWMLNMISIDMTYEKEGESIETRIYHSYLGSQFDENDTINYVSHWRSHNE